MAVDCMDNANSEQRQPVAGGAGQKTHIFVYGTLRKGFWNHLLLRTAAYRGVGRTVEDYALYVARVPYVVKHQAVGPIVGEVYAVDEATLANVDRLEGHPDWYRREKVRVRLGEEEIDAWLYFHNAPSGSLVPSGDFHDR